MSSTMLDRRASRDTLTRTDPSLPWPPSRSEKYAYLGRQHRWLMWLQAVSFSLIAFSIAKFATADLRLMLFLIPMTLYGIGMVVSLFSSTRRRRVTLASHQARVSRWNPEHRPTVDVFLPSAGEPLDLLANTFDHVARLDWPADMTVWVLDDSARPEVRELAEEHGFTYRTRPDRGHLKKAGNLRFGYEQSDAELIVILDADFVPRTDFLHELVPYFDDSAVGIVQSPQYFDTRGKMGWLQRGAGATQEIFYRWVQPARDRAGAAICVGTCAIYRRTALARAGGFAQIGHSEDVHTGVNLMRQGFRVQYVPVLVSKGVCPDNVSGFLSQQYRWCTGSMSLLADATFHESQHIGRQQRLCFWAGFLYYISTAVNAFVAPLPALAMLWLLPQWVKPQNSVWLLGALALWFVVLPLLMHGRWRVTVLRVQYLYSFAHAVAIFHLLTGRTKEWVATGDANTRSTPLAVTITRTMKAYIGITQVLLWVGLARGIHTFGLENFWAMLGFGLLTSFLVVPLLFVRTGAKQPKGRRRRPRVADLTKTSVPESLKPAAAGPRRFRPDIQGLRAIAVTLVVLYHAGVPHITGGYVGVDVFFVISGFLITGQLVREVGKHGGISLRNFYAGRVRRLLPPAAIVVVVTVLAARLWDSIFQVKSVATDALFTTFYALNYRLAAQGVDYQNAAGPVSPLQHMWSLAVEEQFYLAWPLIIMGCVLLGRRRMRWPLLVTSCVVVIAVSLYLSAVVTKSDPPYAYFSIHTRAWELAVGALVALAANRLSRVPAWIAASASWVGVAAVVGSAFYYTNLTPFPGTAALLPTLATALIIAAGCRASRGSVEALLDRRPMQGIGRVSYGWYLWHWPLLVMIPLMAGRELGWGINVEISALALWLAVLTHHLVENPSIRSRLRKPQWLVAGTGLTGATAAVAGVVVFTLPSLVGGGAPAATLNLSKADTGLVHAALVSGLQVVDAPSNLQPAVTTAGADVPASSSDGCHADYATITQGACVFGDPAGKHTLVLFGDSHAQQWLPGLDREARLKHWKVVAWTKSACPIADVKVTNKALGRDYTECYAWRSQTVAKIVKLAPDEVLVSQSDTVAGGQVSDVNWGEGTVAGLAPLTAAHLPIAYMLDTPYPNGSVPECVASHLSNVGACNIGRSNAYLAPGRLPALAAALAAARITAVNPVDWFCTTQGCPAVVGDILVYRDGSHMTAHYSRWLAPMTSGFFVTKKGA